MSLKDVALSAGVGLATVVRVLNECFRKIGTPVKQTSKLTFL
ncbi:LacI family DNA-binding transcriptional regulator [Pantoea eucalypti]|jgi:hypothetical protein|nr:LacI family DNA-binding transcriptional regulator [Pantoea eucalypti]